VCQNQNIPHQGYAYATIQCHLVQKRCLKITYIGSAGKSKVPSMNKARSRWFGKGLHAMVHKAPNVPMEHLIRGLSTSGFVQLFHGSTFGICQQSTLW